jgi:acyl-CoA synthetase (AMP-forming)/AMP-acid ligase II
MIADLLDSGHQFPEREAIVTSGSVTRWGRLLELVTEYTDSLHELTGRRVALRLAPTAASFAALAALDRLGADVFLFDAESDPAEALDLARDLRLAAVLACRDDAACAIESLPHEAHGSGASTVTLLTSGTTGRPKAARHTWASLARPVRKTNAPPPRWLLSYRAHLYAGLQVTLQCWANGGTLVVPPRGAEPTASAELMLASRVEFASATPSYWRRLLLFAPRDVLARVPLAQITLGGEVVDQQVLDALRGCFPQARVVHIYATTELGRCFSVTDGLAGFPVRFIEQASSDGVELRIEEGELLVRSTNAMRGYDTLACEGPSAVDWFRTSDLVEIAGARVHFVGRKSDMINVGGNKVHPLEVESVVRQVRGVADVRVYGKSSSIAGQLVVCELVVAVGADRLQVERDLATHCAMELNAYQRPRIVRVVDRIDLASSGKKIRSDQR